MKKSIFKPGLSAPLLTLSILALTCTVIPGISSAQQQSETLEEIVITGSRIARDPENYLGGMSIVEGSSIEKIPSYNTNDMLLKLPSIGLQGTARNNANGGRGANFTEIHQLGSERTLVLLNSRRMVNTIRDPLGLAVDLQSFPINMIDRIEVLADGASTIYGSDAVGGVVNVITKSDFEGVEVSGGFGLTDDGGGEAYNGGILMGIQGNKGHFIAGATISDTGNIDYQERDWSAVPVLGFLDFGTGAPGVPLMGSGLPPQGRVSTQNRSIIFIPDPATGASFQDYDTFGFSGLNGSAGDGSLQSIIDTGHRFNYNKIEGAGSSIVAPARVIVGGAMGEYNLDNGMTAYGEMLMQHREGTLFFTPLPIAGASGRFTDLIQVPFNNPNVPADALALIQADVLALDPTATAFQMNWRVADLGNRVFDYKVDTLKTTFGLRGDLNDGTRDWTWDTWVTWGRSTLHEVTFDQVNVANLQIAMDPAHCALVSSCPKDLAGNPTLNIFGRSPKSQAEKDFILFDDHDKTEYEMYHLALSAGTKELFQMPAGGVGFAAGLEFRDESGSDVPSGIVQAGDSGGNFSEPTDGSYDVWETYAEFSVPLLTDAEFAQDLTLEGALRYSDYGSIGDELTWKVGGRWTPVNIVSFRGQVSTGFRAPNILELFGGKADNFIGVQDPCNASNRAVNPTADANCALQGVPAFFTQPAGQLKVSQGGNPDLGPETSDHFSVGAVFTPDEFIPNLSIAVDYYDVEIQGAVSTPDPVTVINNCYNSANLSAPECARLSRGPGFDIVRFDLLLENLNSVQTSGIDINSRYALDTEFGHLSFNWLVNWLRDYTEVSSTGTVDDRTDKVTCDVCDFTAYPEWRMNFDAVLSRDNWSVGFAWRYIDGMDIEDGVGVEGFTFTTPAVHYFDAYATYDWQGFQFTVGAQNLGDKDPPYVPSIANNTSTIYDYLGRNYFARASYRF